MRQEPGKETDDLAPPLTCIAFGGRRVMLAVFCRNWLRKSMLLSVYCFRPLCWRDERCTRIVTRLVKGLGRAESLHNRR